MANAVATLSTFPSIAVSAGRPASDSSKFQGRDHGQAGKDKPVPVLIVFGKDEANKPHASAFGEADVGLARKAAELMGMCAMPVETDAVRALAARLPDGRVFASGKAFVPFVKASLFEELLPHLGEDCKEKVAARVSATGTSGKAKVVGAIPDEDTAPVGDAETGKGKNASAGGSIPPAADPTAPKRPTDWSQIGRGSEVLAYEKPGGEWYEAIVVEVRLGDLVALRWRDFEGYPVFVRRREYLGLLHPSFNAV